MCFRLSWGQALVVHCPVRAGHRPDESISHSIGEGRGIWIGCKGERGWSAQALHRSARLEEQLLMMTAIGKEWEGHAKCTFPWANVEPFISTTDKVKLWCRSCTCWFSNNWSDFHYCRWMDWPSLSTSHAGKWVGWWRGAQLPGGCIY